MAAAIDDRLRRNIREQLGRGGQVHFHVAACGPFTGTKRLDVAVAEQIEQIKTVAKTHVPHMIASLAEIL